MRTLIPGVLQPSTDELHLDLISVAPDQQAHGLADIEVGDTPPALTGRDRDAVDRENDVTHLQQPRWLHRFVQCPDARLDREAVEIAAIIGTHPHAARAAHALEALDPDRARSRAILRTRAALRVRLLHGDHESDGDPASKHHRMHHRFLVVVGECATRSRAARAAASSSDATGSDGR